MHVNKQIIVAVIGITAISVVRTWTMNATGTKTAILTPVIMGSFIVCLVLSIVDLFGGAASGIAGGIAMLALFTSILTQMPWTVIFQALNPQPATATGTTKG